MLGFLYERWEGRRIIRTCSGMMQLLSVSSSAPLLGDQERWRLRRGLGKFALDCQSDAGEVSHERACCLKHFAAKQPVLWLMPCHQIPCATNKHTSGVLELVDVHRAYALQQFVYI